VTAERVYLQCPKCKWKIRVKRDETDPPGTALVVLMCGKCNSGDFDEAQYFAADGAQLRYVERATHREGDAP